MSSRQSSSGSSSVPLSRPTQLYHIPQVYTRPHAEPRHLNSLSMYIQIIKWVKYTSHQKVESLAATSLSNLDNMVNNNSIINTKCAEFCTKWLEQFNLIFTLLVHLTTPTISNKNLFLHFNHFLSPYFCIQPYLFLCTAIHTTTKCIFATSAI